MKNKILFIIFWNLELGGIQKRIRDIVIDITNNNSNWTVYLLLRRGKNAFFINQLPLNNKFKLSVYPLQSNTFKVPGGFLFWIAYKWVCLKPDRVLTFLPPLSVAVLAIKQLLFWMKTKVIVNDGVYLTKFLELRNQGWLRFFISHSYAFADSIIVPTQACKKDLVNNYLIQSNVIIVIPSWTLYKVYRPLKKVYDLIYIGRYEEEKNPQLFLDTVRVLHKKGYFIHALMIGSGPMYEKLQRKVDSTGLFKYVLLYQFQPDVSKFLRKSKILVLPSLNEGLPNVVLEAAMCRVPTIANNFKGVEEVILHGKTGYIVRNQSEAVVMIEKLLDDDLLRRQFGMNAQRHVSEHFSHAKQKKFIHTLLN